MTLIYSVSLFAVISFISLIASASRRQEIEVRTYAPVRSDSPEILWPAFPAVPNPAPSFDDVARDYHKIIAACAAKHERKST